MPIYEYKCEDCGKVNEFLIKNTKSENDLVCKNCSGEKLKKMFSAGFISKGKKPGCNDCNMPSGPACGMGGPCGSGGICPM